MNFWGHLEVLRWVLLRCIAVVTLLAVALFCFKDLVFDGIVLAPCNSDFATYRVLCRLGDATGLSGLCPHIEEIEMININLAAQLMTHIRISCCLALVLSLPYLLAEAWFFVRPALYLRERRPAVTAVVAFFFQFFLGLALAYFLIFPLTYNFLGSYQVSARIVNQISLSSYISTFIGMLMMMGLVFEMPIAAYFFARIGVLKSSFLARYRKVAVVVVLVLAAFITPSTDVFTMCLVALPLWMLYEFSRLVVKRVESLASSAAASAE